MRTKLPSSRGYFTVRLSIFDTVWAFVSPLLALYVRDAYILAPPNAELAVAYCTVTGVFSLIAFVAFRLRDEMPYHFSVHDALDVVKAVICAEFMSCVVLFTFTRLEGIPRATPLIHALILTAGLVAARTIARVVNDPVVLVSRRMSFATENIVIVGSTHLSSLYIKMLEAYCPDEKRVVAVLDDRPELAGRSIAGVRIVAVSRDIESVIEELAVHGIHTNRVIIGGEADFLSAEVMKEIQRVCDNREIALDFMPRLVGLSAASETVLEAAPKPAPQPAPAFAPSRYFRVKHVIEFFITLVMISALLPLFVLVCALALLDVGTPVLFWQERIGRGGRPFLLHKIRTLKPPFDWQGEPLPESERQSWLGHLLRRTRLDELPQLINVLVGDMALIGPRPLLPEDQPPDTTVRLMVRPGITGWAQVNGGRNLTPEEKEELDEWYVRNASLLIDLRIALMTLQILFGGKERRSERALAEARALQAREIDGLGRYSVANVAAASIEAKHRP